MKEKNKSLAIIFFLHAVLMSASAYASQPSLQNLLLMRFNACEEVLTAKTIDSLEKDLVLEDALSELQLTAHEDLVANGSLKEAIQNESVIKRLRASAMLIPEIARKTAVAAVVDIKTGQITGFKFKTVKRFRQFLKGAGGKFYREGKYSALDVSGVELQEIELKAIAKFSGLRELNVSEARITAKGAEILAKLVNLTHLDISINFLGEVGASSISKLSNLKTLDIRFNNIDAEGAAGIAKLTNLIALDLSWNFIGPEGAASIAKLTNLTHLDISENNIGDAGVLGISKLINLTTLNISSNRISDAGMLSISNLINLTTLYVGGQNDISDFGVLNLAQLLKLTFLDIYPCSISENTKALIKHKLKNLKLETI